MEKVGGGRVVCKRMIYCCTQLLCKPSGYETSEQSGHGTRVP